VVSFMEGTRHFFFIVSRPALGPTQPSIQWLLVTSLVVKWPGQETNYSSCSKLENEWSGTFHCPLCLCGMHGNKVTFICDCVCILIKNDMYVVTRCLKFVFFWDVTPFRLVTDFLKHVLPP
jgi:hypothetical protein